MNKTLEAAVKEFLSRTEDIATVDIINRLTSEIEALEDIIWRTEEHMRNEVDIAEARAEQWREKYEEEKEFGHW